MLSILTAAETEMYEHSKPKQEKPPSETKGVSVNFDK